jgi:hypothetical protein
MGSLLGSVCYQTSAEALDAYYSGKEPAFTPGAISYLSYFEKVDGDWTIIRESIETDGTVTSLSSAVAPVVTFPACDPAESFLDGMAIGWLIATAMVAAFAIRHLWNSR